MHYPTRSNGWFTISAEIENLLLLSKFTLNCVHMSLSVWPETHSAVDSDTAVQSRTEVIFTAVEFQEEPGMFTRLNRRVRAFDPASWTFNEALTQALNEALSEKFKRSCLTWEFDEAVELATMAQIELTIT